MPCFATRAPGTNRAVQDRQAVTDARHAEAIAHRPAYQFGERRAGLARLDLKGFVQVVVEGDLQTMGNAITLRHLMPTPSPPFDTSFRRHSLRPIGQRCRPVRETL